MRDSIVISVNRVVGGIRLQAVHNGFLRSKLFIGYSLSEAKREFREYLKAECK